MIYEETSVHRVTRCQKQRIRGREVISSFEIIIGRISETQTLSSPAFSLRRFATYAGHGEKTCSKYRKHSFVFTSFRVDSSIFTFVSSFFFVLFFLFLPSSTNDLIPDRRVNAQRTSSSSLELLLSNAPLYNIYLVSFVSFLCQRDLRTVEYVRLEEEKETRRTSLSDPSEIVYRTEIRLLCKSTRSNSFFTRTELYTDRMARSSFGVKIDRR